MATGEIPIRRLPDTADGIEDLMDVDAEIQRQKKIKEKDKMQVVFNEALIGLGYVDTVDYGVVGIGAIDVTIQKRFGELTFGVDGGLAIDRKVPYYSESKGEFCGDAKTAGRLFLPTKFDLFMKWQYGIILPSELSVILSVFNDLDPRYVNGTGLKTSPAKYFGLNETDYQSVGVQGKQYLTRDTHLYYRIFVNNHTDINSDVFNNPTIHTYHTYNKSLDVLFGISSLVSPGQTLWVQVHEAPVWPNEGDAYNRIGAAFGGKFTLVENRLTASVMAHIYDVGDHMVWGAAAQAGIVVIPGWLKFMLIAGVREEPYNEVWTDADGNSSLIPKSPGGRQIEADVCAGLFGDELSLCYMHVWANMGDTSAYPDSVNGILLLYDVAPAINSLLGE